MVTRLLQDPGVTRYPGIFSKSRSRDSQKSNPGIFRDFQKPLNDCILRLSTPFIDHNNLFWDLWSLQEGQESLFKLLTFQQPIFNMDWFSDARRDQSINQTFTCHLFWSQAHVSQQTKDGFNNHACFYSYYILLNIIYHILLYTIYYYILCSIYYYILYILQTNKSSSRPNVWNRPNLWAEKVIPKDPIPLR